MSKHKDCDTYKLRCKKLLREHLRSLPNSPSFRDVAKFLDISERELNKKFEANNSSPFLAKSLVLQLYLGFNIPYKSFVPTRKEIEGFSEKELKRKYTDIQDIKSEWGAIPSDITDFYDINYNVSISEEEAETFQDKYAKIVKKYLSEDIKSIDVYEYLGKGDLYTPIHLEAYSKANKIIFNRIEDLIRHKNVRYKRFLAPPYGKLSNKSNLETCGSEIIKLCSIPLFTHICNCVKTVQNSKNSNTARFYVLDRPWRPHQVGIVVSKKRKIILSEYYKYAEKAGLVPDLLFIEEVNSPDTNKLYKKYKKEIDLFMEDTDQEGWRIDTLHQIKNFIKAAELSAHTGNNSNKILKRIKENLDIKSKILRDIQQNI